MAECSSPRGCSTLISLKVAEQSQKVNGVILHLLRHRSRAVGCEGTLTFSTQFGFKVRAQ